MRSILMLTSIAVLFGHFVGECANRVHAQSAARSSFQTYGIARAKDPNATQEIVQEYLDADPDERVAVRQRLVAEVGKQFEQLQEKREGQLRELEAQVQKLRRLQNERRSAKSSIVDNRVDELLREAQGLGWRSPDFDRNAATPWPVAVPQVPVFEPPAGPPRMRPAAVRKPRLPKLPNPSAPQLPL